jgi:hypothetical protein
MNSKQAEQKRLQAYKVISYLLEKAGMFETEEGARALDYFLEDGFDEYFLPWPRDEQGYPVP